MEKLLLLSAAVLVAQAANPPAECKYSNLGVEYAGKVSETISGLPCQAWASQSPHSHTIGEARFVSNLPEGSLSRAKNYCRNPDKERGGPWCYTTDPAVRWQYCDVPHCYPPMECKTTELGQEFNGLVDKTQSGLSCQRWNQQTPHKHYRNNPQKFPDASLDDALNYCRNPDSEPGGPWCYTTDRSVRWQYCDVQLCSPVCKKTRLGKEYTGTKSYTVDGLQCQAWSSQSPHKHSRNNPKAFPDDSLADAANYCRNPDGEPGGPWCYTVDRTVRWQYCGIPDCSPTDCKNTKRGREYVGTRSRTVNGRQCQRWDRQYPHEHSRNNPIQFPDESLAAATNYCRNPDGEPNGPWCYTTDRSVRWEYCGIPECQGANTV